MRTSQILFKSDAMMESITAQRMSYNADRIAEYERRGVESIEIRPRTDCCKYCDGLYKNADGTYKRFSIETFNKSLRPGGTNQGLLKKDWSPFVLIAHPWCRCAPHAVYA